MKFCIGARPRRAPPSTRYRIATLGEALALVLLVANAAAGASVVVEPRQTFVAGPVAYPGPLVDCAPCASCYLDAPSVDRVSTTAGATHGAQLGAHLTSSYREQPERWHGQPRVLLPVRLRYCRWRK